MSTALHLFFEDYRLQDNPVLQQSQTKRIVGGVLIDNQEIEMTPLQETALLLLKEQFMKENSTLLLRQGNPRTELLRMLDISRADKITFNIPQNPSNQQVLNSLLRELRNLEIEIRPFSDLPTLSRYPLINDQGKPIELLRDFKKTFLTELQPSCGNFAVKPTHCPDISNFYPLPALEMPANPNSVIHHFLHRKLQHYRNPSYEFHYGGSGLSAYFRYGLLSKRHVIHRIRHLYEHNPHYGKETGLFLHRLIQGEFANHLSITTEHRLLNEHLNHHYYQFEFENSEENWQKWCDGKTGVPIVDAIMRSLQKNRIIPAIQRRIAAIYFVQVLHQDWRLGDNWFRDTLADYNPAISAWNWQHIAGSLTSSDTPCLFLPVEKLARELDPDCHFIRKYVPECAKLRNGEIHLLNYRGPTPATHTGKRQSEYLMKLKRCGIEFRQ